MGILIDKYVDLESRYAIYGENGYYIDSFIIHHIIVSELHLGMSFQEMKKFIKKCEITITEEEIKNFLEKKMDEEHPTLREELQREQIPQIIDLCTTTQEEIDMEAKDFGQSILKARYQFEPYSLTYFQTYISKLKEKFTTLFDILEDLDACKNGKLSEEGRNRFSDLDFHINEYGDIYVTDAIRLMNAVIYNINDLYQKVMQGNNCETYLTFKKSLHQLANNGISEEEIYPSKEVQIKDLDLNAHPQFIELSDAQKEEIIQTYSDHEDFLEDEEPKTKELQMEIKN